MTLLTKEIETRLRRNGQFNASQHLRGKPKIDFKPVVKLVCPWNGVTYLLSELDPDDPNWSYALCDRGDGHPGMDQICISELEALRGPDRQTVVRDETFRARKTLGQYAADAIRHRRIVA